MLLQISDGPPRYIFLPSVSITSTDLVGKVVTKRLRNHICLTLLITFESVFLLFSFSVILSLFLYILG